MTEEQPQKRQYPSVGRIVHYKQAVTLSCTAAIITSVNEQDLDKTQFVSLHIFTRGGLWRENVPYGDGVGSWHWPERT